ncbi:hypothetical protein PVAP13_5NG130000 [Panicum virgatum]|uniref:RING-type E3 ubiquitin transferase n=1 Tax=Panicum virgatum TaxID=38727 RepID=A0A8T0RRX2_PANVG|nr:hypothetical protein PVAP13_5NG130000 [Panicum virgatum]
MRKEAVGGERAAGAAGRQEREIFVKMDSQVLDCTICFEPLRPPIYQCEVGHAVCYVCRGKLCNTCPICCRGIGFSRCFALEHVVDTVKVPCANANYGCKQFIIYYQKEKHEKTCLHAPCFCPEDGCSFKGSTGSLLDHFVIEHKWSPTNFHYNEAQRISIPRHCRFTLLVGEEDQSMFLVMDPHVGSSSLHDGAQLGSFFLLVPPELVDESTDGLTINIRIDKIKCVVHH